MKTWIWIDGAFREEAFLPAADRAFRFGMSVFETIAVCDGRALFWDEHLARLRTACAAAEFAEPEVSGHPDLSGRTGMLRIYVTAGDGGPLLAADAPRVVALFEEAPLPGREEFSRGLRLVVSRAPVCPVLGGWKTGNYWPHVQALRSARAQGCDEAVLVNPQGAVLSAAMANLFVVTGDRFLTPPRVFGARDGVVAAWVRDHVPVEVAPLTVESLLSATECFVTNSRLGVFPVVDIEGRVLPARAAGDWLASLYREEVLRQ